MSTEQVIERMGRGLTLKWYGKMFASMSTLHTMQDVSYGQCVLLPEPAEFEVHARKSGYCIAHIDVYEFQTIPQRYGSPKEEWREVRLRALGLSLDATLASLREYLGRNPQYLPAKP